MTGAAFRETGKRRLIFAMTLKLTYAAIPEQPRKVIHAVRVEDDFASMPEIDEIAAKLRERMLARHGEQSADIVVVVGNSKETLRLFGEPVAVARVRAAMFNAAVTWSPIDLG